MAGRWKPYVNGPGAIQQPDYSPNDADRAWVERELGDVAVVSPAERPAYDDEPAYAAASVDGTIYGKGVVKIYNDGTALPVNLVDVWVESLGRDQ